MTDSERIKKVIEWSKMTTNEFSASLGFERAMNLYNILNGKTGISVKLCNRICNKYQQINYEWLLKGEGNMLINHIATNIPDPPPKPPPQISRDAMDLYRDIGIEQMKSMVFDMKAQINELLSTIKSQLPKLLQANNTNGFIFLLLK